MSDIKIAYLEIKKKVTFLSDRDDYLNASEREELDMLNQQYKSLSVELTKEDEEWVDDKFSDWYMEYITLETIGNIKPGEGD